MNFILANYVKPVLLKTRENSCNCSSFEHDGKEYLISRNVSYYMGEDFVYHINEKCKTRNLLYEIVDDSGNLNFVKELISPPGDPNSRFYGYEDIRTMCWENGVYFSCTTVNGDDTGTMTFGKIENLDLNVIKQIRTSNRREKNWVPIENMPGNYIYSFDPITIVDSNREICIRAKERFNLPLSGSTPLLEYKDGYIALVHSKDRNLRYTHQFVELGPDLRIRRISVPFSFLGAKTEFCVDAKIIGGKIRLLPSVFDGISYMFTFSLEILESILDGKFSNSDVVNIYDKLFVDACLVSKEVAMVFAIYGTEKSKEVAREFLKIENLDNALIHRIRGRLR